MDKVKGILSEGDYAELSKDLSAECDRLERSAAEGRKKVEDVVAVGDELLVKVTEIDQQGRINLSRKDALADLAAKQK